MNIQDLKNRFGIIGTSPALERCIEIAMQVAPTDLTVLITGESGSGKEVFPQIIHQLSLRKFGTYIAVNCGAIPEGTIDSELFGHEKGSFTGAHEARKGYFEVVNEGTIFLDEVGELPLATQARLLRVLETGEFIRVGSSKVLKTNVRVLAATNVQMQEAVRTGKFREDLYYRLNTVPIQIPALRARREDIHLLFRKFAADFAARYRMPSIKLEPDSVQMLEHYAWPGNVRQLKNIAEQISVIEKSRNIQAEVLARYLPHIPASGLPVLTGRGEKSEGDISERELLYKVLFDMKKELTELKKIVVSLLQRGGEAELHLGEDSEQYINQMVKEMSVVGSSAIIPVQPATVAEPGIIHIQQKPLVEESLSLEERERELIEKALEKNKGKRKNAARELGISERTLYRKINEYNIKG